MCRSVQCVEVIHYKILMNKQNYISSDYQSVLLWWDEISVELSVSMLGHECPKPLDDKENGEKTVRPKLI